MNGCPKCLGDPEQCTGVLGCCFHNLAFALYELARAAATTARPHEIPPEVGSCAAEIRRVLTRPRAARGLAPPRPDGVVSAPTLARLAGVDNKTIHNWVRGNKIAAYRSPGGHLRFRPEDVATLLATLGRKTEGP